MIMCEGGGIMLCMNNHDKIYVIIKLQAQSRFHTVVFPPSTALHRMLCMSLGNIELRF